MQGRLHAAAYSTNTHEIPFIFFRKYIGLTTWCGVNTIYTTICDPPQSRCRPGKAEVEGLAWKSLGKTDCVGTCFWWINDRERMVAILLADRQAQNKIALQQVLSQLNLCKLRSYNAIQLKISSIPTQSNISILFFVDTRNNASHIWNCWYPEYTYFTVFST